MSIKAGQCLFVQPLAALRRSLGRTILAGAIFVSLAGTAHSSPGSREQGAVRPVAATLRGHVTNEAGQPLADARVLVAMPATDMRFVDPSTKHKRVVARTDASGVYQLYVPGITRPTRVSIDAMKPGYERFVGTLMAGGFVEEVDLAPGGEARADFVLKPALYFSGTVVDARGKPLAGVKIASDFRSATKGAAVDRTASNADGSFELFDFPLDRRKLSLEDLPGVISFSLPEYAEFKTDDVYLLKPEQRTNLRIVLKRQYTVSGRVVDATGAPASGSLVMAGTDGRTRLQTAKADARGEFQFEKLLAGSMILSAHDAAFKQAINLPLLLDSDQRELKLHLQPIVLPRDVKQYTVLGMQLADLTPELRSAYALDARPGVLVLDHGTQNPGPFTEGSVFLSVSTKPVRNVREFVETMLAATTAERKPEYWVDLQYFADTQQPNVDIGNPVRLTRTDLPELAEVLNECLADEQSAIVRLAQLGAQFQFKPVTDKGRAGRQISWIILGDKWKGGDADLRPLFALSFEGLVVHGQGRVSDKALEQLRKARPDLFADRPSQTYLGAVLRVNPQTDNWQVAKVVPLSPAERAGLREGDTLLEFAGKTAAQLGGFLTPTSPLKPGEKATAKVLRDRRTLSITIEMGAWD